MFIAIWAQDKNGLIGKNGRLPWRLPADMHFFKSHAYNNYLVMGRNTYEGLGELSKEYHQIIVLTSDKMYKPHDHAWVMHSFEEVLKWAATIEDDVYIGGGDRIIKGLLPYTSVIYRTLIDETFEGDAYVKEIDFSDFTLDSEKIGQIDEENIYPHRFEKWVRKSGTLSSLIS